MKCLTCDKEIRNDPRRSKARPQKYCDMRCYVSRDAAPESVREQLRLKVLLKELPIFCCQCGDRFVRVRIDQVTCSHKCALKRKKMNTNLMEKARRQWVLRKQIKCENCDNLFNRIRCSQVFCCKKCARQYREGSKKAADVMKEAQVNLE